MTHPTGHEHHQHAHGELSPCELHKKFANAKGLHLLPPMQCRHITANIDTFEKPSSLTYSFPVSVLAILGVEFTLISTEIPLTEFQILPDQKCRSATLISKNSLRGPPLV